MEISIAMSVQPTQTCILTLGQPLNSQDLDFLQVGLKVEVCMDFSISKSILPHSNHGRNTDDQSSTFLLELHTLF